VIAAHGVLVPNAATRPEEVEQAPVVRASVLAAVRQVLGARAAASVS
jgi:hypothetical protein